jgi:hypothetical protein
VSSLLPSFRWSDTAQPDNVVSIRREAGRTEQGRTESGES